MIHARVFLKALAKAWEQGFAAAAEAAGECCGCNVYNALDPSDPADKPIKNPYARKS